MEVLSSSTVALEPLGVLLAFSRKTRSSALILLPRDICS